MSERVAERRGLYVNRIKKDGSGNVELEYCWDEGYASDFISGSGSVYVAGIPDIIRKDGWTVEMQEGRITGSTIVFTVVLKLDDVEMECMDIAYYVDEYGQVEK